MKLCFLSLAIFQSVEIENPSFGKEMLGVKEMEPGLKGFG